MWDYTQIWTPNNLLIHYEYTAIIYRNYHPCDHHIRELLSVRSQFWSKVSMWCTVKNHTQNYLCHPTISNFTSASFPLGPQPGTLDLTTTWALILIDEEKRRAYQRVWWHLNIKLSTNLNQKLKMVDKCPNFVFKFINISCPIRYEIILTYEFLTICFDCTCNQWNSNYSNSSLPPRRHVSNTDNTGITVFERVDVELATRNVITPQPSCQFGDPCLD